MPGDKLIYLRHDKDKAGVLEREQCLRSGGGKEEYSRVFKVPLEGLCHLR